MPKDKRTAPDPNFTGWPSGVPFIIGNEGCERFSFYGMKSILYVYLVSMYTAAALPHAQDDATATVHLFITGVYALPMIGAIIADRLAGKYRTILWLSLVYCLGHGCLALFEGNPTGIYLGLALIAVGSGGIKPCVSANVGDQFGKGNWSRLEKVYQAFYFIINFGSFFATLLIPWLQKTYGASVAFALPGILMFIATIIFWMGRDRFVHVPPKPGGKLGLLDALSSAALFMTLGSLFFTAGQATAIKLTTSGACLLLGLVLFQVRQRVAADDGFLAVMLYSLRAKFGGIAEEGSREHGGRLADHWFFGPAARKFGESTAKGPIAVLKIMSVFFFVSIFWALFEQHASSWIRQAEMMDRHVTLPFFGVIDILPSQIPAANPALVMILIPFVSLVVYPLIGKLGFKMTPLRRMTCGMVLASVAFMSVAVLQKAVDHGALDGHKVHIGWQIISHFLMTMAEVMVSVTGLEFAYSQAPKRMKSTIMGFWLLTVALGNVLVALTAHFAHLQLVDFFWVFSWLMAGAAVLFGVRAAFYQYQDHSQ